MKPAVYDSASPFLGTLCFLLTVSEPLARMAVSPALSDDLDALVDTRMGGAPLGDVIKRAFLEAGLCSIPMFEVFQPAAPLTIELRNVLIELIKKEPGFKPAQQFVVTAQLDGIFGAAHAMATSPPSKKRAASPT